MTPPPRPIALLLAVAACGGGEHLRPRPIVLVTDDPTVDDALARARTAVVEGDLAVAARVLRNLLAAHPRDPLAPVAGVLLARVLLALDDVAAATRQLAPGVPAAPGDPAAALDPALAMQRALVLGLLAARRRDVGGGLAQLRPLEGRMIDRAQTAEVECGLAALEAEPGVAPGVAPGRAPGAPNAGGALKALARVETLAEEGVLWPPTGLPCDRAATRDAALVGLLAGVAEPAVLADTLDLLPAESSLRLPVARRLRTVAEARHETARWVRWLADLPADEATLMPVVGASGPPPVVVGVLAPVSGPRASLGVDLVREVQLALEVAPATGVAVEDEGTTPATAVAAFDRLAARHVTAVIGPTQEELARAVALRAAAGGVDLYLPAPHGDATEGPRVHLAGPALRDRAAAVAAAVRVRGARVYVATPADARWGARGEAGEVAGEFAARVRELLLTAGVAVIDGDGARGDLRVVLGPFGREARALLADRAAAAPARWILDARSGLPGSAGVWVGLRPGADFDAHQTRYCAVAGEPPGELGMLAYDAARAILAAARGERPGRALAAGWPVAAAEAGEAGSDALAATRRCPVVAPPPPLDDATGTGGTDPAPATAARPTGR